MGLGREEKKEGRDLVLRMGAITKSRNTKDRKDTEQFFTPQHNVKKCKYEKLRVVMLGINNKSEHQHVNKPSRISPSKVLQS